MGLLWKSRPRVCVQGARLLASCLIMATAALGLAAPGRASAQDKTQAPSATSASTPARSQFSQAVGTIKSVQADSITVSTASGEVTATLAGATKILRVSPGEKDLKNATTLPAQDLQPGDRVLVRGQASADGHSIAALAVVVMKKTDVTAKQQHDREEWQKNGVDGSVTKVDAATGTITISRGGIAKQSVVLHVSKETILRRYAPGSVNFDDAKPAPIDQIQVGDQLNALGTRNADGSEMNAQEIVSGTFDYVEGTIKAIDVANNTMTVEDPVRKSVALKISSDSLLKKLPPEMAQRIAMRLKAASGSGGANHPSADGSGQGATEHAGEGKSQTWHRAGGSGPPDLQRVLSRVPDSKLADFQKGDAVMIVATGGGDSGTLTAIKVLAGVDAILRASPNRSASALLSPWSLSEPSGEGEAAPQ